MINPTTNKTNKSNILVKIRKSVLLVTLLLLVGYGGYRLGQKGVTLSVLPNQPQILINSSPPPSKEVDFSLFWDVWSKLEKNYIDKTKLDTQKMVYGAISGMVSALGDPYTIFLPPKENSDYKQDLNGTFEGIGAQLGSKDNKIIVVTPLKDHPAEKAGLRAGDWIVKVDGETTNGWTVPQAVTKIRGPKGSQVTLNILHDGTDTPTDVKITRASITVKSVEYETKTWPQACQNEECKLVGVLKLTRFGDTTNDEWNLAVVKVKQDISAGKIKGLILDLRNNPGGYFQSSIHVASEFIKSGVVVIQENSDGSRENYSVNRIGGLLDIPLAVLINKGSASAAEIVAGALKDYSRGKLIGETTFGKGSVQTPEDLPGGSGLHITTARWILPKGDWINGKGIKPDLEVVNPTATDAADLQLEKAVTELVH